MLFIVFIFLALLVIINTNSKVPMWGDLGGFSPLGVRVVLSL
jgi:hypothetical protein